MSQTYIFIYQTVCLVNNKTYIGVHKTDNIDDGYIGCGVFRNEDAKRKYVFHNAVKKHGYDAFKRYILDFFDTYEMALEEERFLVNEVWVNSENNYNTALGGRGSTSAWMCEEKKKSWKKCIKEGVKKWMDNGGSDIMAKPRPNAKKIRKFGPANISFGNPSVRRRKVIQSDLKGNFIAIHDSLHIAAESVSNRPSNIANCCVGRHKTCSGYLFKYQSYSNKELQVREQNLNRTFKKRGRQVIRTEFNSSIQIEYSSLVEAARNTQCTPGVIFNSLKKDLLVKGKYTFSYKTNNV